ncbi:non-structural maintenance of chromosomes element 1 homolog [Lethenteron reissneri]|uniref:non-structural maintenance of chromosomes element 1 homolog n=1 Tax=Lethenteron reissneri TaxID=7753 RepID=UPI002AB6FBC1|nr:non-structural maintenance of chromosomes element 1 homolog [Lethenteron reissneri]XP_061425788.1 non-structural maintenance of chromosomes element 1 homolog [Lethenteron reissneri]XP_061425790.1 non-structural maintenance of chromosomes element 1 homolog [Lethenteron reissneri]XP_061425791.1 non-structural maintenance of chromosomes element 1 homolog [Lethenteron reissneri]XP_061425792.1 non-structural maintenance of chromosomes element 1 homolog [Lethenteron reissneri]XP_061425874.1 non-s
MEAQGRMSSSHRLFLQKMMAHGCLDIASSVKVHNECCRLFKEHYAHDQLDAFIGVINNHIQPFFMVIQKGTSEEDGKTHYALINIEQNEITLLASDYSEVELELFNKTMELIVDSGVGMASSMDILNLVDQLQCKKMKKDNAELLLQRLVQDKWLCMENGYLSLSPRCLIEMDPFIRSRFGNVEICYLCHKIALKGQVCSNCSVKVHAPCSAKFFKRNRSRVCPRCKSPWINEPRDNARPVQYDEGKGSTSSDAMEL